MKILVADRDNICKLERLGKTVVTKIYENIRVALTKLTLAQLMGASPQFGRGFGERKIKLVTGEIYDKLATILSTGKKPTKSTLAKLRVDIMDIEGYDSITTDGFLEGFTNFISFWKELNKYVDLSYLLTENTNKHNILDKQIFDNSKIVFTGFRNKQLQKYIENNGGSVSTSVSTRTTLVVFADKSGSKYKKAIEIGVSVMSLTKFLNKYQIVV